VATLPAASRAVTVTLVAAPAVTEPGRPVSVRLVAVPADTVMLTLSERVPSVTPSV
jgi:hypothetical protein